MNQAQRTIKVLLVQDRGEANAQPADWLGQFVDVISVESADDLQNLLATSNFDYVIAKPEWFRSLQRGDRMRAPTDFAETVEQGVGIVDVAGELIWANPRLLGFPEQVREFAKQECLETLSWARGEPDPQRRTQIAGRRATFQCPDSGHYELTATPIIDIDHQVTQVVAVVRDVTLARARQEQFDAIDHAGRDLVRLDAEQISRLDTEERLALLEQKIIRYLRDLMHFDHFSIHILDKKSNKLELVLCSGLAREDAAVDLYAAEEGNGIAGWVAYHARGYICADTSKDTRYLKCLQGARSSLTVPLRLNDEVIGVLNVESNQLNAFDETSRQLAELFGRDIATVLHILDLLVTERYTTTGRLGSDVMAEITGPLNDILTDVENLIEDYIGHDDLRHRLNRIAGDAVTIRESIKQVTTPKRGIIGRHPVGVRRRDPVLTGKHILIVDDEAMIRETVRDVLASYGCEVVISDDGEQAVALIQQQSFDLVLSDIKMPGKNGYEVFAASKTASPTTPVILMTGFGYDPNHSLIRARREGLAAVLFKPFKVDQLLGEIRSALRAVAE